MSLGWNLPPGVSGNEPHLTGEPEPEECPTCHGGGVTISGKIGEGYIECPTCRGLGTVTPEEPEPEYEPPEEQG